MKNIFDRPLLSQDRSLTLVGFFWAMIAVMAAFFAPIIFFSL